MPVPAPFRLDAPKNAAPSSRLSPPSPILGTTTYTWWPASISSRARLHSRDAQAGFSARGTTWVEIFWRPAGRVSSTDTSRSPNTVMATVRGMGVAVMTRRCGRAPSVPRRPSRCSTPKRCCSSTTTRPKSWKRTSSESRAWVPITIWAAPAASSCSTLRLARVPMEAVSRRTRTRRGFSPLLQGVSSAEPAAESSVSESSGAAISPRMSSTERKCCSASTSVGASIADWPPASATCSMARRATTVLPEPTSPCSRRFMGDSLDRSAAISAPTFCCPSVSS